MWNKDHYIRQYRHKILNISNVISFMGIIVGVFDLDNYKGLFFYCFPFVILLLIILLVISLIMKKIDEKNSNDLSKIKCLEIYGPSLIYFIFALIIFII